MPGEGSLREHHLEPWEVDQYCAASSWHSLQEEEESDPCRGAVEAKPQGRYLAKTG